MIELFICEQNWQKKTALTSACTGSNGFSDNFSVFSHILTLSDVFVYNSPNERISYLQAKLLATLEATLQEMQLLLIWFVAMQLALSSPPPYHQLLFLELWLLSPSWAVRKAEFCEESIRRQFSTSANCSWIMAYLWSIAPHTFYLFM